MWKNSNQPIIIWRSAELQYNEKLLSEGNVRFGTAQKWVDWENERGQGRGDLLEGVFAACSLDDYAMVRQLYGKYKDVEPKSYPPLVYYRRNRTMNLPCLCFYIVRAGAFECPDEEGVHGVTTNIPATYYRDFADQMSPEDVERLPQEKQPSILVFREFDFFLTALRQKLYSIGVQKEQILIDVIQYCDLKNPFICHRDPPFELFVKDNRFVNQSELRIVINTDDNRITSKLTEDSILIGCMKTAAELKQIYPYDGTRLELDVSVSEM